MMDVLTLKMVALIFNVFFLPRCSSFLESTESHICISKNDALSCICKDRENFSMFPSTNFDIRLIQVSGCGSVVITFGAVTQLELEKIVFSDIHNLTVQPYSFAGAQSLYTLEIENIGFFHVLTAGFAGLFNVTDVIIRNVSSMIVDEEGFGGILTVENFEIQSINFIDIKRNAFTLSNFTTFKVADSGIVMQSKSFLIHNTTSVLFQNCSIQNVKEYSLSIAYVDLVTFFECNIESLDTNSVYIEHSGKFVFDTCSVTTLNEYAFYLEDLTKGLKFTHNVIKFSNGPPVFFEDQNSSISLEDQDSSVLVTDNSFICNCDIYWMWIVEKPFYDGKSSFCVGSNICLSYITPSLDSHGNCKGLEPKNQIDVSTNIESSEVIKERVDICISSQAISRATLLKVPLAILIIIFNLVVFMRSV